MGRGLNLTRQSNLNGLGVTALITLFFSFYAPALVFIFIPASLALTWIVCSDPKFRFPIAGLPFLGLALLCLASTFWSSEPEKTLRSSLEFTLCTALAVFLPQAISLRLTLATLWGSATVLGLMCLPSLPGAITSGAPMLGIFASKNINAVSAEFWCFISAYMVLETGRPAWIRLIAALTTVMAIVFIQYSRAAGSTVSVGVFLILILVGLGYAAIPRRFRALALISAIPLVLAAIISAPDLLAAWQDFQANVLQKDSTLTGRTYIWDVADRVSREHPMWGVGYEAFWTHGNLYAEGIWRHFKNDFRGGFNFHNVFIEYRVALGQVGFLYIIGLYGYVGLFVAHSWLMYKSVVRIFLFAYFASIYLHSFSEVTMGSPFSVPTVLWMATPSFLMGLKQNARNGTA